MEEAKQFLVSHLSRPSNSVASPGKNVSVANKCISSEVTTVNPAVSHFRPKMVLNGAASQGTGVPANSFGNCSCENELLGEDRKILKHNPAERIAAKTALGHPYFDSLDKSQL
ncbi:Uncharacterized protein Rs2_28524 [Raphanus sativus]|nr:Uncharacterized protein Rs2_28524 [Raphanus sativus]